MDTSTAVRRRVAACAVFCLVSSTVVADNWPRFRGPNGQGIAQDAAIPVQWTQADFAWRVTLPGSGHSSPVIWDDMAFVTCAGEDAQVFSLLRIRASDGETIWKRDYQFATPEIHPLNSHATSTPAVDERGVYTIWYGENDALVVAVSHDGEEMWRRTFGPSVSINGPSQSPMVYEGKLVFTFEQEENDVGLQSYWYALDCSTGETVWRLDRETSDKASSSVPCIYRAPNGEEQLIFSSRAHGLTAIDPADGTVVWEEQAALPVRVISSPVLAGNLIVATCGAGSRGVQLSTVRPVGENASNAQIVYTSDERFVPYVPTSIAVDNLLFLYQDRGSVTCMEIETGAVLWSERPGGKFFGSPVLVDGRLYCINTAGQVVVLSAAPEYELLAINDLGEPSNATPAVAGGRMLLRTRSHLMCIAAPAGS